MFSGFDIPEENWSKLPHQFVNALPLVSTVGELKVILYILRHTWGFQDTEKKITLDEFENGRKRKDGSRMDSGTGLSRPTIISSLERAEQHGFISVETNDSDKARIKKTYSLQMLKDFTPEVKKLNPSSKETLPRSEKDTVRNKPKKDNSATKKKSRAASKKPTPVGVLVFRANAHRFPSKSWYSDIEKRVGSAATDLELWGRVVKEWVGCGWNPMNVSGMLDCFDKKEIPGQKGRYKDQGNSSMSQNMAWIQEMNQEDVASGR